jgi:hypothetical protein
MMLKSKLKGGKMPLFYRIALPARRLRAKLPTGKPFFDFPALPQTRAVCENDWTQAPFQDRSWSPPKLY